VRPLKALILFDKERRAENLEKDLWKSATERSIDVCFNLEDSENYDLIILVGDDCFFLNWFHRLGFSRPFLPVGLDESESFIAEVSLNDLNTVFEKLSEGEFLLEENPVIRGRVDGGGEIHAVNEVAVFPSKSAVIMEYELWLDGEFVWRDRGDGIIISTPLGSTAYSLSAGGPLVFPGSRVFVVTPVNSLDPARRPLIVPENRKIILEEISSRVSVEVVADGVKRLKVSGNISVAKYRKSLKLVRLAKTSSLGLRIYRKAKLSERLVDVPPSAKLVYKVLEYEGPLTQKDITSKTFLPVRTVRRALQLLEKRGLVGEVPNIRDLRQKLYYIKGREKSG